MRNMRRLNSHSIDLIVKCSASGVRSNSDSFLYESRWVHLTVTVSHIKWNAKPYISKLFMTFEIVYLYKCFLFISVHFSETYPETWEWSCASAQVTQVTLESLRKSARPSSSVNIQKKHLSFSFSLLWNHSRSSLDSFMWSHRSADTQTFSWALLVTPTSSDARFKCSL